MTQWEYRLQEITSALAWDLEGFLNNLGEEGWELITTSNNILIFKRSK